MIRWLKDGYAAAERKYKRGYNAVMFSCEHMAQLSSAELDRDLTLRERITRRLHLKVCTWCRRYQAQLRFLRKNLRDYAEQYPEKGPESLDTDAKDRIRNALQKKDSENL